MCISIIFSLVQAFSQFMVIISHSVYFVRLFFFLLSNATHDVSISKSLYVKHFVISSSTNTLPILHFLSSLPPPPLPTPLPLRFFHLFFFFFSQNVLLSRNLPQSYKHPLVDIASCQKLFYAILLTYKAFFVFCLVVVELVVDTLLFFFEVSLWHFSIKVNKQKRRIKHFLSFVCLFISKVFFPFLSFSHFFFLSLWLSSGSTKTRQWKSIKRKHTHTQTVTQNCVKYNVFQRIFTDWRQWNTVLMFRVSWG